MLDSEHSTITNTSISRDYDEPSDVGSLRVKVYEYDRIPMHPPSPDYVPGPEHPPSPDYVPGLEHPLSPAYVPYVSEPAYPEFMPPEDDVFPAEEQPLPATVSPTADSPGVDMLLAIPTPPSSPLTSYSSPLPQIPSLPLATSPTDARAPLGYRAPMIRLRAESPSTSHLLPLPPPIVLLLTRASMVMMRAAALSTYILSPRSKILPLGTPPSGTLPLLPIPLPTSSPPLLLPSTNYRVNVPEVTLPPRKRLCIALGPKFKVGECSSAPTSRPTGGFRVDYGFDGTMDVKIRRDPDREIGYDTDEIYGRLDDAQDDRLLMSGQLNLLRRDMRSHARTTRLMESAARALREAWVQSMDASDMAHSETHMVALYSQQRLARDPTHLDVPEEARYNGLFYGKGRYMPGLEHPLSPAYVPYVSEPAYPEFMPTEDDVFPAEEQPLPATVSPTADSPEEDEGEDEEVEDEHLALADSAGVDRLLAIPTPPSSPLTSYSSPLPQIPSLPLATSPIDAGAPLGYEAPMIRLRAESPSTSHLLPLPPPIVLLLTRASMVMMRAAAPSTYILAPRSEILPSGTPPSGTPPLLPIPLPTSSPPLLLPSTNYRVNVPEVTLPPRKRLCISLGPKFKVEECSSAPTARPTGGIRVDYGFDGTMDVEIRRDLDKEIGYVITDVWKNPYEIAEEIRATDLNLLRRDMRSHARTTRLMKSAARASREAWVQSMDASDMVRFETHMVALYSQQRLARDPTHPDVPEEAGSSS
nr:hypothetical protein [Tanacetum cinerariifolium]